MKYFVLTILILICPGLLNGQVRVRLFTVLGPEAAVFTVNEGSYSVAGDGEMSMTLKRGDNLLVSHYGEKVLVSTRNNAGFICDTLKITGLGGKDTFSLRPTTPSGSARTYSGSLHCFYDLEKVLFINVCDIEEYLAGVVRTEGGEGRHIEYSRSQALLARTYLHRHDDRHLPDNFNLCDDIHCQAYNGINTDQVIARAVEQTRGQIVMDRDSILIMPAFHANCGGETARAEDAWLSGLPYLKKVTDPYCTSSRNATWRTSLHLQEWISYLRRSGYSGSVNPGGIFAFTQATRLADYRVGTFSLPLRQIRSDLNLRSSFFSVRIEGDSVVLAGRGYGHGVGLCQEGAMAMALKGFTYRQIIDFYFSEVIISDIKNGRKPEKVL